jgi:hypothetical protein
MRVLLRRINPIGRDVVAGGAVAVGSEAERRRGRRGGEARRGRKGEEGEEVRRTTPNKCFEAQAGM